ncbi:hypothetical protein KIM372_00160 [Bombiscardovia nodaiensis]|uniref:PTS EIIA type-2 domain-containing protein n=1 Tax=Bombiscardovia nodaiensis TaxID=2932181 RepID=A0ABN6S7I5_9BIFI|nr:hypothetical protein KIM372_00160 [Bombiscardovia nodaiensis]
MKWLIAWEPESAEGIRSKADLFEWIASYAREQGLVADAQLVPGLLEERESIGSTLVSDQLANPHLQSDTVLHSAVVMLKLAQPISGWEGAEPIERFMVTLLPAQPALADVAELRQWYRKLADSRVANVLSCGQCEDVRQLIDMERE